MPGLSTISQIRIPFQKDPRPFAALVQCQTNLRRVRVWGLGVSHSPACAALRPAASNLSARRFMRCASSSRVVDASTCTSCMRHPTLILRSLSKSLTSKAPTFTALTLKGWELQCAHQQNSRNQPIFPSPRNNKPKAGIQSATSEK